MYIRSAPNFRALLVFSCFHLAAFVGGTLQHPGDKFPKAFSSAFWSRHPFFLPCFVTSSVAAITWIFAFFFLKEVGFSLHNTLAYPYLHSQTQVSRRGPDRMKSYGTTVVDRIGDDPNEAGNTPAPKPASLKAALTPPVIIGILNYALAAFIDISMFSIFSVYLAVPISSGGLNLSPEKVGFANAGLGFLIGVSQVTLFPTLVRRLGPKRLLMRTIACSFLVFLAFPMVHLWVKHTTPENGSSKWLWVGISLILVSWTLFEAGGGKHSSFVFACLSVQYLSLSCH